MLTVEELFSLLFGARKDGDEKAEKEYNDKIKTGEYVPTIIEPEGWEYTTKDKSEIKPSKG